MLYFFALSLFLLIIVFLKMHFIELKLNQSTLVINRIPFILDITKLITRTAIVNRSAKPNDPRCEKNHRKRRGKHFRRMSDVVRKRLLDHSLNLVVDSHETQTQGNHTQHGANVIFLWDFHPFYMIFSSSISLSLIC